MDSFAVVLYMNIAYEINLLNKISIQLFTKEWSNINWHFKQEQLKIQSEVESLNFMEMTNEILANLRLAGHYNK